MDHRLPAQEYPSREEAAAPEKARPDSTVQQYAGSVATGVRWGAALALLWVAASTIAINLAAKRTLDVYPLVVGLWLVASFWAIRRTHSARSFVVATVALLVVDTIGDIVAMGAWLRGPWSALNSAGLPMLGRPLIAEWRWDLGAEALVDGYWTAFWGWGVPLRTAVLIAGVVLGSSRGVRFPPVSTPLRTALVALCLAGATLALYACHVEDVLYFTLLGYPPFLMRTPLDFSYLPPTLGVVWTTPTVVLAAGIGLVVATILLDVAVEASAED